MASTVLQRAQEVLWLWTEVVLDIIKPLSLYYYSHMLHVWYVYLHLGDFSVYHMFYYNPYSDIYNLVI